MHEKSTMTTLRAGVPGEESGTPGTTAQKSHSRFVTRNPGAWWLRRDIIWSKPNAMPESAEDRPSSAHEYIFLLTKSKRYYYDGDAIKEPYSESTLREAEYGYRGTATKEYLAAGAQDPSATKTRIIETIRRRRGMVASVRLDRDQVGPPSQMRSLVSDTGDRYMSGRVRAKHAIENGETLGRNARSVWTINTEPYPEAHFATFPEALPEKCIKAGSKIGDTILDPFCGSGTTGQVAIQLGRSFIGIELNPTYAQLARQRIGSAAPLFAVEATA